MSALDRVGDTLGEELGPLPVWVWAIGAGGVVYWLRNRGSGVQSVPALVPSQQGANDPQGQVTLQPGEAVYDPNTGQLLGTANAPFSPQDPTVLQPGESLFNPATGAIEGAFSAGPSGPAGPAGPASKPKSSVLKTPKLKGRGAIRAPFGHNRPTPPRGYRSLGLGSGFWEFLPVAGRARKSARAKAQHARPNPAPTPARAGGKSRPRSSASTHPTSTNHRAPAQAPARAPARGQATPSAPPARRSKPTTPVRGGATIRQHPAATHPRPTPRPGAHPAPRPSAPPPRNANRSKARRGPRPAPKKR